MRHSHKQAELRFYSAAFRKNETRRKRKFSWETTPSKPLVEMVKLHRLDRDTEGKRMLDLGCGDGRHSEYFLNLGYEVVGTDFCKEAISVCRNRFRGKKNMSFHITDLTEEGSLILFGQFDVVLDCCLGAGITKS